MAGFADVDITPTAFRRKGGHETTAALWSKMCPEAGDMMADASLELLGELHAAPRG